VARTFEQEYVALGDLFAELYCFEEPFAHRQRVEQLVLRGRPVVSWDIRDRRSNPGSAAQFASQIHVYTPFEHRQS